MRSPRSSQHSQYVSETSLRATDGFHTSIVSGRTSNPYVQLIARQSAQPAFEHEWNSPSSANLYAGWLAWKTPPLARNAAAMALIASAAWSPASYNLVAP